MDNDLAQNEVVLECLTANCSDCTGFYVNRLFNHRLQCMHGCHKIKEKMLEEVETLQTC